MVIRDPGLEKCGGWVDNTWESKPQSVVRSSAMVDARSGGGGSPGLPRQRCAVWRGARGCFNLHLVREHV